jgi:hypothetical protein
MKTSRLFNGTNVRSYLKETAPHVTQISSDFWPALELRIKRSIDQAVRLNRNHSRLTGSEMLAGTSMTFVGGLKNGVKG